MKGIMLQGTSSDVGKSVLATAFCRIFARRGYRVAPFKSQNMSNNSYVTANAREIGRAQGVQAEAANTEATVYMNPILLKPRSDQSSEVVLFGKSHHTYSGKQYRDKFYRTGLEAIRHSLSVLEDSYDVVVIEGAGSPVEINLHDRELVNMKVAEMADVPVFLIADIERGGVFASVVGTLALLSPAERQRVQGIVINKFRGDVSLFEDGIRWLETKTGVKVVGVVPYIPDLKIEGEDSLSLASRFTHSVRKAIDIAVIKLPYVSNYTDLEPFLYEKDVSIRFVQHADELGTPDVVILPGTRSTTADLQFVKKRSLDQVIRQFIKNGGRVIGLCGGYQMLCERLLDPFGSDSGTPGLETDGLGLLPMVTSFLNEKKTVRSVGTLHPDSGFPALAVDGFEIHLGETTFRERAGYSPFLFCEDGSEEGCCSSDGRIIGTYFHHLFYNDGFRNQWLNEIRTEKGSAARHVYIKEQRDEAYDQLADHVSRFLDIDGVLKTIERWGT